MADISSNTSVPRVIPTHQEINSDTLEYGKQLAASIAKLDQTVTNAYNHINKLFVLYEQNIDEIVKRLANDDFSQKAENKGVADSQQQINLQKNYIQLLADQNAAFLEFNISLKQIVSKLTPMTVSQTMQADNNTATAMRVSYEELMFNRYMSSKFGVDAEHADNFQEKSKAILDIKNDQNALLKIPVINALYQQDQGILKQISGAQDTKALIPVLIEAMSKANVAGNKEAVATGQDYFGKDANIFAYMTSSLVQVLEGQRRSDFTSEDFRHQREQDAVWMAEQHAEQSNRNLSANLGVSDAQSEYVNNVTITEQGGVTRSSGVQEYALREASQKMFRNPDEAAAIYGGVDDFNKTLAFMNQSLGGISPMFEGLGGSAGKASEGMSDFAKYLGLTVEGLKATGLLMVTEANALNYAMKPYGERPPEYTLQEQKEKLLLANSEKEKKENQVTLDYLKEKKGWNVDYNNEMFRFDIRDKQGKVVGNSGERLEDLTKRVNELRAPGNQEKIKQLETWSGYKVDVDPKTLEIGLFTAQGKMVADIGKKLKGSFDDIQWGVDNAVKSQWQEDYWGPKRKQNEQDLSSEVYNFKKNINDDQQKVSEGKNKSVISSSSQLQQGMPKTNLNSSATQVSKPSQQVNEVSITGGKQPHQLDAKRKQYINENSIVSEGKNKTIISFSSEAQQGMTRTNLNGPAIQLSKPSQQVNGVSITVGKQPNQLNTKRKRQISKNQTVSEGKNKSVIAAPAEAQRGMPKTNLNSPAAQVSKSYQQVNEVSITGDKQPHQLDAKRKQHIGKNPTAADVKMGKDCSHIENLSNTYKYDVKITVNPPSGDPIKIAQQVCEQLKRHTCGSGMGDRKYEQRATVK
ncbi:hypothetical protein [Commensalibacter papalotli (ex Botero et al. 2024)]|uniref:hypothetical protein n=1 Tax=Commensalibacter papalotli (ex Botero et al. 2024) TaxID=2972766 RepID=UPI0022FF9BBE|nr:hypothetical protein [Commensalibacter papalotli (ex Botero et al. 2024)]CAI3946747.1 unnamed protein product [Commensalibacter papalotli (ex Botero et al. 2024)]